MNCTRVVDLADDHVDGLLPAQVSSAFYRHLRGCAGCRSYVSELSTTVALLATLEPAAPPLETRRRLSALFIGWSRTRCP